MAQPKPDRQRAYEMTIECVHAQTSPKQPPGVEPKRVWMHLVRHGPLSHDEARTAKQAAVENGDLIQWRDADGTVRLTRADDEDALERARDWLVDGIDEWTESDREQLGTLNAALMEVSGDD